MRKRMKTFYLRDFIGKPLISKDDTVDIYEWIKSSSNGKVKPGFNYRVCMDGIESDDTFIYGTLVTQIKEDVRDEKKMFLYGLTISLLEILKIPAFEPIRGRVLG